MKHVDALVVAHPVIGSVFDEQLNQLSVAVETRKMQWVKAFFRLRRRVDPERNLLSNLALDVGQGLFRELRTFRQAQSLALLMPQAFG